MTPHDEQIAALRAQLAEAPTDATALAELDRLMLAAGDPGQLAQHLRQKLATAGDDASRTAAALQLAEVLVAQLQDAPGAAAVLQATANAAPGQIALWQRLTALYDQLGDGPQALAAMQREVGLMAAGAPRQARQLALASLAGHAVGDLERALNALQQILVDAPQDPGAIALLEDFTQQAAAPAVLQQLRQLLADALRASSRWPQLVSTLSSIVEASGDAESRVRSLRQLAQVRQAHLGDAAGAFADLARAFAEMPQDDALRLEMEALAEQAGQWEQLAQAYASALSQLGDGEPGRRVRRKLAEVLERRLGRGAEAVEYLQSLGGGGLPEDLPGLETMERLLRQEGRHAELAEVLAALLLRLQASEVDRRHRLSLELGQLCAGPIGDRGRAIDVYRALLLEDPRNVDGLHALASLYGEAGLDAELLPLLARLCELGPQNAGIVADLFALAQLQARAGQLDAAVASYRALLQRKRDHEEAILGLEQLVDQLSNRSEVAQILEPLYAARQDHAKLAWVLERKLEGVQEASARKALLRRIGDIYENRLQQRPRAFELARQSLAEDPADMGVRMWIEKLAGETGALRELAQAYVEEGARAQPPLNLQFFRRAAVLLHEKVADLPAAVLQYQAILAVEPRDEKALTGLETIFRASQDAHALVGVLEARVAVTAGIERKREMLHEVAKLQAEALSDRQAAVATLRQILALTPDDLPTFTQLEAWLTELGAFDVLAEVYQVEAARLTERRSRDGVSRRLELMGRRAQILDHQFADSDGAMVLCSQILGEDGHHASTLQYLLTRAQVGAMPAVQLLEKVYQGQKAWGPYIQLLDQKLIHTAETDLRRSIYLEIARVYDSEQKQGDLAFLALTRAYNEARTDLTLLAELERIAAAYELWEDLVAVLSADLDALPDAKLRLHLLHRLGEICGDRLKDVDAASEHLRSALQYDPSDEVALAALDGLLSQNERWAALVDVLERRIEVAREPSQKSQLLERLAAVWGDRLQDAEAALRCHKQILAIDPDHPLTLRSMEKLYRGVHDFDNLALNLHRQAAVLTEPAEQVRIWTAAASLYTEDLDDNGQGIVAWLKVAELEPAHEEANQALQILLTAEERWEDLATVYRRQLALTQSPEAKLDINRRLGVILGDKLGRRDDALSSWLKVLEQDSKNADALRALLPLYSERAQWAEFVAMARRLIPLLDPGEAKEVRFDLARALGENLGLRDEAIHLAREVRATEPHTVAQLQRLAEMLCNIQAWEEAVLAFEKAGALETEVEAKVALYHQAAVVYRDRMNKPHEARVAYEAMTAARPADEVAFATLADIYRATNDWRKLVALCETHLPHAPAAQRLPLLCEIRDVQDGRLGEKEMAFIAGVRVYKENPVDQAAADVLQRIALEGDAVEELAGLFEDELDNILDSQARVQSLRRLAGLYRDQLKDVSAAEGALNRILSLEPSDVAALDALATLGESEERFDKQVMALERKLATLRDQGASKGLLFDIARIWEDKIGEVDQAVTSLQRVLQIDGADVEALDSLARIFQSHGRYRELAHVLTRKVEITQDPGQSLGLRMRVASLCETELGDAESAIQWYRDVLEFEAGNVQALTALERLYTSLERWSELVQVFETQVQQAHSEATQVDLLGKMAAIYENEFDSIKDAAACYERALSFAPKSLPTIKSLQRVLRVMGEWPRLIEVLSSHVAVLSDSNAVVEIYLEMGEIFYKEMARVDKAEQIYNSARELNPKSAGALHALGKLYERSGNWFQALDMLQREAELRGSDPEALPVLTRIGRINEDMLMDREAAKAAYQRALAIDATYPPALQALKEIARSSEDWQTYAEHLITEAETSDDVEQKTELFAEAAKFFYQVREDEASAIKYYQKALSITQDHVESARSLADIFFRNELWEEAQALYLLVIDKIAKGADAKEFCQKYYRLGYIGDKLGQPAQALTFYRQAFEADATYLPALEGLGQALIAGSAWEEAQKVFQTILIHHKNALTESEIVDVQWQLGDLLLKQSQPDRAYKQFEKALEVDADHPASLNALAHLDSGAGRWELAYKRLSRFADVAPGPQRVAVLVEASKIGREKLNNLDLAIEPLERARRLGSAPLEVLELLAEASMAAGFAAKAVDVYEQAAQVADQPAKKAEIFFQLGRICEEHLHNNPQAVFKYNEALDAAPTLFKAFEAIERILGGMQEWALLEANYRAMIARAKDLSLAVRIVLWRSLGDLYRKVLRQVDNAIMAYEVLQKMDSGKVEYITALAELYAQKPDSQIKAIAMHHELIMQTSAPVPVLRILRKLYQAQRNFDGVYAICSALVLMKEADEEERKLQEYLQRGVPARASRALSEDQWKLLLVPGVHGAIGTLAATLYRTAPDFVTLPAKDLGLKKKDQIDVRASELYFANMIKYVAGALNMPPVDVYRKSGSMEALHLVHAQPPALVAGESNEIFRESAQKVVLYHIARNMAYARPELLLARVYVGSELRDLLLGLCIVYNRSLQHNGDPREVERWATTFEKLPPAALKRLQAPAQAAFTELTQGAPLQAYAEAVEEVAARAGLVAAGDLMAAARGLSEGGDGASPLPVRDRIRGLVLFAVSQNYLEIRNLMGAALVENAAAPSKAVG